MILLIRHTIGFDLTKVILIINRDHLLHAAGVGLLCKHLRYEYNANNLQPTVLYRYRKSFLI